TTEASPASMKQILAIGRFAVSRRCRNLSVTGSRYGSSISRSPRARLPRTRFVGLELTRSAVTATALCECIWSRRVKVLYFERRIKGSACHVRRRPMRYFIHIITNEERLIDPDGGEFTDLESARAEASQSARDLMAEELRCGRPVPFAWQAQVADGAGNVLLNLPFARLGFRQGIAPQFAGTGRPTSAEAHLALIERAKTTFARARTTNAEIRDGLSELRNQLRRLAQYSGALGNGSA